MPSSTDAPSAAATKLTKFPGGIALITFDHPKRSANLLSAAVLDELEQHLDQLSSGETAGLIITSAKPKIFIAGADLTEFAAGLDRPAEEVVATSKRGQDLFMRIAALPFPTVAAIDGICVGGGAELAVWCDRRVMANSPATQFGFPEVKLGLFPGWGGTVRTPRMIGLGNAVELITGGESVSAKEAHRLGLADDLIECPQRDPGSIGSLESLSADPLMAAAARMIESEGKSQRYARDREKWSQPIAMTETELAFLGATASAVIQQKTGGHYPAPLAALEVLLEGSQLDQAAACQLEAEGFAPLFGSPVNRALLNVFFLQDRAKKASPAEADAQLPKSVAVIGAGIMGQGIAANNLKRGFEVTLTDARPEAAAAGMAAALQEAAYDKTVKGPSLDKLASLAPHIRAAEVPADKTDLVIEAIVEDLQIKQQVLGQLEEQLSDDATLCSNTSTLPIADLASGLKRPEQFCGLHFFNPVRKMPLIEVIRGPQTSEATITRMTAYARRLGKTPIVVNDGPGFLVNRLLLPYMNEAAVLLAEGVPAKAIEKAAKAFGMPMGPLTLYDVVGLDTCIHAGGVLQRAFPDRVAPATIVERLVEAGRLGQKSGGGFFDYAPSKPGKPAKGVPSPDAQALIDKLAAEQPSPTERTDLTDRLMLPMLLEATRALEDNIVDDPRDVDLALILGIGFPPHKGGLFHWADSIGAEQILERLKPLQSLGERYAVTPLLQQTAQASGKFLDR